MRTTECCSLISRALLYVPYCVSRYDSNRTLTYSLQDTKAMQSIITDVRDSIFRGYLKSAALV